MHGVALCEVIDCVGTAYQFECRACGYSAHVCGGRDSGMRVTLLTSVCGNCRALVDVPVGFPGRTALLLPRTMIRRSGAARSARGVNHAPWAKSRPCPKCEARMEKGGLVSLWD